MRFISKWVVAGLICTLALCGNVFAASEITPILETPARLDDIEGHINDADDPAIWAHPEDLSKSLVIVTLKKGGLDVYDLQGNRIQHVTPKPIPGVAANPARFNNVDIVFGMPMQDAKVDVAVVSDRYNDMVRFFTISPAALAVGRDPLVEVTAQNQGTVFNDNLDEVAKGDLTTYGLAVTQVSGETGKAFAYVSQNDRTTLAKVELIPMEHQKIGFNVVATHDLPNSFELPNGETWATAHDDDGELPHVEGIVVDDANDAVYFAQEKVGIWRGSLDDSFENLVLIDKTNEFGVPYSRTWNKEEEEYDIELLWEQDQDYGSDYLAEDVEGLTLYDAGNGEGYLLASSQGSNEFVVYDRKSNAYIGNFVIVADQEAGIDGDQECDGAAVTNLNLGGEFETGLLVVQDGENMPEIFVNGDEKAANTNFKFVRWGDIANAMGLVINNK